MSADIPPDKPEDGLPQVDAAPAEPDRPGRMIYAARQRSGMALEELSAHTKISVATLKAMEADDFARLAEPVYVQGYYRKCAQVLGLSSDDIVAAYRHHGHPENSGKPARMLLAEEGTDFVGDDGHEHGRRLWWIVLIIVIIVIIAVWLLRRHSIMGTATKMPAAATSTVSSGNAGETAATQETHQKLKASNASAPVQGETRQTLATDSSTAAAAAHTVTPEPASSISVKKTQMAETGGIVASTRAAAEDLKLQFGTPSWVRITDSTGKVMLAGTQQPGEQQISGGTPPYTLVIGNAHKVKVFYDGQPVNFESDISSNSVAHFNVPLQH